MELLRRLLFIRYLTKIELLVRGNGARVILNILASTIVTIFQLAASWQHFIDFMVITA